MSEEISELDAYIDKIKFLRELIDELVAHEGAEGFSESTNKMLEKHYDWIYP